LLIHWSEKAEEDAGEILVHIAQDNVTAAYAVFDAIQQQVNLLAEHPKLGRVGRVKGTRELVISGTPYITAYKISGEAIYILRVLHGARNWNKQFNK
jgi:toxin ParE1/3/4